MQIYNSLRCTFIKNTKALAISFEGISLFQKMLFENGDD